MEFSNKVVLITGAAQGIGKCISAQFAAQGAVVCGIDLQAGCYMQGDIADAQVLERYVAKVIADYGHVDILINNALPPTHGIDECSHADMLYALAVGVAAPFYLCKLCLPYFAKGASVVNISSTRERMSQPQTESYAAAKGGIGALTHALAMSLAGKARVNAISPGWIDTACTQYSGADALQHPVQRVGNPADIAHMALYLCTEKAGFINGENITIDGGMSRQMIYHGDGGWKREV